MTSKVTARDESGKENVTWKVEAKSVGEATKSARSEAIKIFGESFQLSVEELPEMPTPRWA